MFVVSSCLCRVKKTQPLSRVLAFRFEHFFLLTLKGTCESLKLLVTLPGKNVYCVVGSFFCFVYAILFFWLFFCDWLFRGVTFAHRQGLKWNMLQWGWPLIMHDIWFFESFLHGFPYICTLELRASFRTSGNFSVSEQQLFISKYPVPSAAGTG